MFLRFEKPEQRLKQATVSPELKVSNNQLSYEQQIKPPLAGASGRYPTAVHFCPHS